jgi:hypothetical protein
MSKEIVMGGWVSIIPTKLYNSFVKRGFIAKGSIHISDSTDIMDQFCDIMEMNGKRYVAKSKSEARRYVAQGMKKLKSVYFANPQNYEIMHKEVSAWYKEVFDYVEKWLKDKNFIKLQRGSFKGGFCAETDPKRDVVTNWGAPLADEGNKVVQIKEKFGRIVVYFGGLTKQERTKIDRFAKAVEKRFDCCADFC